METPIESTQLGSLLIDSPSRRGEHAAAGCRRLHSWSADGRRVCWRTTHESAAVDVEQWTAAVPEALARRWPLPRTEFWAAWTRAEVHAKLLDTPILTWVRTHGLDAPDPSGVRTWTQRVDDLLVTCGYLDTASACGARAAEGGTDT